MNARRQFLVTVLVVALVVAAGVYLQRQVGPKALAEPVAGTATSGAWFCPHGGGPQGTKDWRATLAVANPGSAPVHIRVTEIGSEKPAGTEASVVSPGREVLMDVPADSPEASTYVEYFGGWVSAGWVIRAQGAISGVGAESCTPEADRTWTLADGDVSLPQGVKATEGNDTDLVIMNPFASDAALSVVLYADQRSVTTKDLTDFVLPAMRSISIPLAKIVKGPEALGAQVRVSVGRVAAATLSTSFTDGIRSTEGLPGPPPERTFLPAGTRHASIQLAITAPAPQGVTVSGTVHRRKDSQPVADLNGEQQQQGATSAAHETSITGPSTYEITASGGVASAVRTLAAGTSHDRASTSGSAVAAAAWVVPPAAASEPALPSILLFDPGTKDAKVTLTAIPSDKGKAPKPATVTVPAGRSTSAPARFASAVATSSVLVVSTGPPIVAASAAFSEGQHGVGGFAIATGVVDPVDGNNA
ncbi:MAG: DUF5719 family protein [Actinomycetota bacterium]